MKTRHNINALPSRHPLAQAIALVLALGASGAQAATFNVTSNADDGAGSLRQAVSDANTAPGADDISFDPGLGTITLTSGQIDITETLTITGPAAGQTISGNNASRIFGVTERDQPLTLENLTLTEGYTTADGRGLSPGERTCTVELGEGGAICTLGDLTLTNSTIAGNHTIGQAASGGGVFVEDGNVTLTRSTVSGNSTTAGSGGGLRILGHLVERVLLTDSIVSDNHAQGGGGIAVFQAETTLVRSTVTGNDTTGSGGGLLVSAGRATLTDSIVMNNHAQRSGGGIWVTDFSAELTNSIVSDNTSAVYGGGIYSYYASVSLTDSTVSGNRADIRGGGLSIAADATLTNSTVSGNRSTVGAGGGLFVRGNATLTNSTVTDNHTAVGVGGIDFAKFYYPGTLSLTSTILAANTGPGGNSRPSSTSSMLDVRSSLFGDAATEINGANINNIFTNTPGLAPLADNGCAVPAGAPGYTMCVPTHALLASSPALNTGANFLNLVSDQRGSSFARVVGSAPDIGALEDSSLPQPPILNVTSNADSGFGSLRQIVAEANTRPGIDMITFYEGLGPITLTSGQVDITEGLTISAPAAGQIINGNNASRIFAVTVPEKPLTLENLTLTAGVATGGQADPLTCAANTGEGGAICALGDLTLTNSTVSGNQATAFGGGLFVASGYTVLTGSSVLDNQTVGDAVNGGGLALPDGPVRLIHSTVAGNRVQGQSAAFGGGLYVHGNATLIHSNVSDNRTTADADSHGGGLWVANGDLATLTNSIVSGNHAEGNTAQGGGIWLSMDYTDGSTNLGVRNSTLADNRTTGIHAQGGGVFVPDHDRNQVGINNSTVSGNQAEGNNAEGGGLFVSSGILRIGTSTVTDNHASTGAGGVELVGTASHLSISSTILAANTGSKGNLSLPVNSNSTNTFVSYSLFGDEVAEINGDNSNNVFTDVPGLDPLANNGCAIPAGAPDNATCAPTHALLASSPAYDAGFNFNLDYDQRGEGFPREIGPPDIGAIEGESLARPDKIGVYRPEGRRFYLDLDGSGVWDNTPTDATYKFGVAGQAISGDWDGDGTDEIGIYKASKKRFYLDLNGNGVWDGVGTDARYEFRVAGKPIVGDWDGDGADDIGIYKASRKRFYLDFNGNGEWDGKTIDVRYSFNVEGTAVIGDWNGDGTDQIGIYRDSVQQFYLDLDSNGVWDGSAEDAIYRFGVAGNPIIGDWNGNGSDNIGVYRPSASRFYFDFNGNGEWDGAPDDTTTVFSIRGDDDEVEAIIGKW